MKFKKKFLTAILAGLMTFGTFGGVNDAQAASRKEVASIDVVTANDFQYWYDNSPTKQKIIAFVTDVTNPNSPNYIPPEDRIATFDMDGTFYCETAPLYFQEMMFFYRVLEDPNYTAPKKYLNLAKKIQPKVMSKEKLTPEENKMHFEGLTAVYAGMTPEEYRAYVRNFMETNEVGLTNLKRGEAFYLPMVEIISYLTNNGFNVYIDSACGVDTTRELVKDVIPIQFDRVIGSDFNYTSTHMGNETPKNHFYDRRKEKVIISGKPINENAKTVKIFSILNQIGKYPVLAFGNSMGDSGMLEYTLQNPKYKSAAFYVLCDDVERERGNLKRAASDKAFATKRGWNTISMHDEFKTIYGDNVKVDR
ncbi:MAG: haloacid dehalogenase-like hydrolase [Selenomonadaceae bacterium]|nr:haloacid dehalogenase-like hydrolase [Selenomonadaceae bacterium]